MITISFSYCYCEIQRILLLISVSNQRLSMRVLKSMLTHRGAVYLPVYNAGLFSLIDGVLAMDLYLSKRSLLCTIVPMTTSADILAHCAKQLAPCNCIVTSLKKIKRRADLVVPLTYNIIEEETRELTVIKFYNEQYVTYNAAITRARCFAMMCSNICSHCHT